MKDYTIIIHDRGHDLDVELRSPSIPFMLYDAIRAVVKQYNSQYLQKDEPKR